MRTLATGGPGAARPRGRWVLALAVLAAVFALHVLTAEDTTVADVSAAHTAAVGVHAAPGVLSSAEALTHPALAEIPTGHGPETWAVGCLLFLTALCFVAVAWRTWTIPLARATHRWSRRSTGPPVWSVARLSLGVTRI